MWTQFCGHYGIHFFQCQSADQVFPFTCFFIFLAFNDLASEDHSLHIENRQLIVIHFLFGMEHGDISALTNAIPKSFQYLRYSSAN